MWRRESHRPRQRPSHLLQKYTTRTKNKGKNENTLPPCLAEPAHNKRAGEDDDFDDDVKGWNGDDSYLSSNDLDLPEKKKKRVRNRSNKSEINWTMAMKRHWNTPQKEKAMAQITIKCTELHTVHVHLLPRNLFCKLLW
jgi:hypothetical protein